MKIIGRILVGLVVVVVLLAVVAGGLGYYTVRRSFPQTSGSLALPGLQAQVEVIRDKQGIPHIYAANTHDLFMAQGYVHAQDRFYQMDFWRHETAGRLSELYGQSTLGTDKFLRTLGWHRIAEQEYAAADPDTKALLDAYAAGVNVYLSTHSAADISLEYSVLAINGLSGYKPEPWTPADSLAWGKAMAWDLGGNLDDEIQRAILTKAIGPAMTNDYLPTYPSDHPIIVPNPATGSLPLQSLQKQVAAVDALLGAHFGGIGSNNWVIAGSRTTTGKPLLANDPHLSIQMPSIWYEVDLHCQPVSDACPYQVSGYSFAGVPGVVIGHNARIAWGFTNVNPDVQDLYIEKINPANPNQYQVNGQWKDMAVVQDQIAVKGGSSVPLTIRSTRHGPLITDVYGLDQFAQQAGLDASSQYAMSLRWTALEPDYLFRSIFKIDRASNWNEFRDALRDFAAPSQNAIYADVDGNIGYQTPGNVPIRKQGDGLAPVPGWTDDYEWTGYIPFEKLPYAYNPPQGYIATANNAVVGPDYPYLITLQWDAGYRAQRIVSMIQAQPKLSIDTIQQIQGDDMNLGATEVLPYLLALSFDDPKLNAALGQLRSWDDQMRIDSQPAAIYMSFFNRLLSDTFDDKVPQNYWLTGDDRSWVILRNLLAKPDSAWWDNSKTSAVEKRDDILRQAFTESYADLEKRLGTDSSKWTWGQLHTATFSNLTLGKSGIAVIDNLFNRGPFPVAGGASIVNATSSNMAVDDGNGSGDPFAVASLPSMRMIVDLSNLDNSLQVFTTGDSGHAYAPHYVDMADHWRLIQYYPMLWSRANVEAQSEAKLTLTP
jgi:penicillin G amidase